MTTRIIDVNSAVNLPVDATADMARERLWMSTLNALSAFQMYRQHVGVHVNGPAVAKYLLTDPHFPRTVTFCLGEIESSLSVLTDYQAPLQAARVAWRRLEAMSFDDVSPATLHEHLDQIQADLGRLHDTISRKYFSLHQLATMQEQHQRQ
jgi:uncharacterized alpha-E superfamily protein